MLVLWAVMAGPVSAGVAVPSTNDSIGRAVAWLHTQQLPDGSFGVRLADGTYLPSASVTADVVYALARVGEDPAGPAWTRGGKSALAALAVLTPEYTASGDAGQTGKVARAVAAAGGDPRAFGGVDLVAIIQKAYDPTTGRYDPNLLFRHTLAIEGLLLAGEPVPTAALTALLQAQRPNGGWFWSFEGDQTDVDTTGRVLQLLAGRVKMQAPEVWEKAARYLYTELAASGGWAAGAVPGPTNANSTALAVTGLRAVGLDPQLACFRRAGQGGLDALLSYQEASGAFVYIRQPGREESRLMATSDALIALGEPLAQLPMAELAQCQPKSQNLLRGAWCKMPFGRFVGLCFE